MDLPELEHLTPDTLPAELAVPADATGVVVVDLDRIASNWQSLRDHVAPAVCAAVVKADAYGLGAHRVIPRLHRAGCRVFFVATLSEGIAARALTGPQATILVLDGIFPGTQQAFLAHNLWPVLSTLADMEAWAEGVGRDDPRRPCALHVDTGLNRLGLSSGEVREFAGNLHLQDGLEVRLVMSHLACADEPDHPKNRQQREIFEALKPVLPHTARSLAASDGLMLGEDFHYSMVRPGYALYGGQAFQGARTPVEPVVCAFARILQVRDAAPPHTVGYSATYQIPEKTRLATIASGYADGYIRAASRAGPGNGEGGAVIVNGESCPLTGRVSMDLITVDVGHLERVPERGQWAELIGPRLTLEQAGRGARTIGYEILTSLSRRFHRVYLERLPDASDG